MAEWLIRKDPKVGRYWDRLATRDQTEQDAFSAAERLLSTTPYQRDHAPGVVKHLKGQYHCHHEYRNLPNEQRIFYKIWSRQEIADARRRKQADVPDEPVWENNQLGLVVLFFAGPHPKEKGRN